MNPISTISLTAILLALAGAACAQDNRVASAAAAASTPAALPAAAPSTVAGREPLQIYRQILPDGRVVYSDKAVDGVKVDHTITMTAPIKGNLWSTEPGTRPVNAPSSRPTSVQKSALLPAAGNKKMTTASDQALASVMRAEMLLDDARKRQAGGTAVLAGERREGADGGSPYSEAYLLRQKKLAADVANAEQELKQAIAERDGIR